MNPDIKKQWVSALRSGKYRQGRKVLHSSYNTYCCLGVLCELARESGVKIDYVEGYEGALPRIFYDNEAYELPPSVREWAGVENSNPAVTAPSPFRDTDEEGNVVIERTSLAELNDDGATFEAIAQIIEEQL